MDTASRLSVIRELNYLKFMTLSIRLRVEYGNFFVFVCLVPFLC